MSTAAFSKENTYEKLFSYDIKFPNKESADYTNVSKTNDVVLQNVALLLTENFLDLALLNRTHTKPNSYCQLLNKWLNEKELLYTCAGKCKKNKILWDNYIEKLWTALSETKVTVIEESDGQGHEQKQNWCERSRYNNTNPFASEWIPKRCDTDDSEFSESLDQSCAPTAESAGTTSVVPLYFTSIGSTINSYFSKKRQQWKHFNEEENEALGNSFENTNTQIRNGLNSLFYQST
ncbi:PIR protein [Plasmodium ovale]|uniref:PIR protein n=1 Tax=Plasmodium ovale TaxID=36330 RepID=A0A1D3JGL2_PLAOA|nr:PIR protein [Plasmodium ovale]